MSKPDFTIAAFDPAGSMIGTADKFYANLSPKWLLETSRFLAAHGDQFKTHWQGPLAHLETQFTASDGIALVTFRTRGIVVGSIALAAGENMVAEKYVLRMFVDSLKEAQITKFLSDSEKPFEQLFEINARPLMVAVPWGDQRITEEDDDLVQELAIHLAGAFFQTESKKRLDAARR
jgi:hypothetical protein